MPKVANKIKQLITNEIINTFKPQVLSHDISVSQDTKFLQRKDCNVRV